MKQYKLIVQDTFNKLKLGKVYNIKDSIRNECETDQDIKTIKKLEKSLNLIDEIIKENKENILKNDVNIFNTWDLLEVCYE